MSEPAQPASAPGAARRLVGDADRTLAAVSGGFLRLEDAALFGWLLLGLPLSRWLAGSSGPNAGDPLGSEPDTLTGLIWLAATILAIVVIATRSPGDPVIGFEDMSTPRSYAPLPFLVSLAIVSHTAFARLGFEFEALVGVIFIVTMVSYVAYPTCPACPGRCVGC